MVMPDLKDAKVKVVEVPGYDFTGKGKGCLTMLSCDGRRQTQKEHENKRKNKQKARSKIIFY